MHVVEAVTIQQDVDPWLNLEALSQYSGLSVRSLRAYLTDPNHPLTHYRMKEPHVVACKPRKDGMGPRTLTVSPMERGMRRLRIVAASGIPNEATGITR